MQIFTDILNIFYPNTCLSCDNILTTNEKTVCTDCIYNLPLTDYTKNNDISVEKIFYGRVKIEQATALLYYTKKGIVQQLMHNLKYRGYEEVGVFIGDWLGKEIVKHSCFKDIDYIIPVPLHKNRLKQRGYNQVTKFGEKLSHYLEKPLIKDVLIKKSASSTQTKKSRFERAKNVKELFFLTDLLKFENKHILLIDDIITTGATLEACANELLKTKNIKISIAVMAVTE